MDQSGEPSRPPRSGLPRTWTRQGQGADPNRPRVRELRPFRAGRDGVPRDAVAPHMVPVQVVKLNRLTYELRVRAYPTPHGWTTKDVWNHFSAYGNINTIAIHPATGDTTISFRPLPDPRTLAPGHFQHTCQLSDGRNWTFDLDAESSQGRFADSPVNPLRQYPSRMTIPLLHFGLGVERDTQHVGILWQTERGSDPCVTLNVAQRHLQVDFDISVPTASGDHQTRQVRLVFGLARVKTLFHAAPTGEGPTAYHLIFTTEFPPVVWIKTLDPDSTHSKPFEWNETEHLWDRVTRLPTASETDREPVQLRSSADCIIDVGRWRTYDLAFRSSEKHTSIYKTFLQALEDHNVTVTPKADLHLHRAHRADLWYAWDRWHEAHEELDEDAIPLAFAARYQLEVCLSTGVLHEADINGHFLQLLSGVGTEKTVALLEAAAAQGRRLYDPSDIFHLEFPAIGRKSLNSCAQIPAVNITPCTMHISTRVPETTNRVIRKFKRFEDRFLRVRFSDEKDLGKLVSSLQRAQDVWDRVARALKHGIVIAGRHYEFLAFGNSQIREHGAYFFASDDKLSAANIRNWMGNFDHILAIAKNASRLGQCFSTTHAIPFGYTIEPIPDVERNGYCFTDGVGKISPFLAQLIDSYDGRKSKYPPSVFQFRMAGYKGVLAVDPSLGPYTIQMRPSQEKFRAAYDGLEIIRTSSFASARLNQQLILILSGLGVSDDVLMDKVTTLVANLTQAMSDGEMAVNLLRKNVDQNRMSLALADMVENGFVAAGDPFVTACLRLYKAWTLKFVKEKAHIPIEEGANLLGTTDESRTLRGHRGAGEGDDSPLPEIFVQVSDPSNGHEYRVIRGRCLLARNPSLHPGDIRVVMAVDVPELHHLRDCVVLPQTGDRDLSSMCSGGDLDGDDYLVIWDRTLMPKIQNAEPMSYEAPAPVTRADGGKVQVDDIADFFVDYLQHDTLAMVAVNHRKWAEWESDGVFSQKCLQLAELHSRAVDFVKTGVPAVLEPSLKCWHNPHWIPRRKSYHSKKVLGQIYDAIEEDKFDDTPESTFDQRVLRTCTIDPEMASKARALKESYDTALERLMAQYDIEHEAEVFMTMVLHHDPAHGDYKFAEVVGEAIRNLREEYRGQCYSAAGTTALHRDWRKVKPFIVAMYAVTEDEVKRAMAGRDEPDWKVPKLSFPWIFAPEMGRIATARDTHTLADIEIDEPLRATETEAGEEEQALATAMGVKVNEKIQTLPLPQILTDHGLIDIPEDDPLDIFQYRGKNFESAWGANLTLLHREFNSSPPPPRAETTD